MNDELLTVDDLPMFTKLRLTAFGEAVITIANDPTFDDWDFSQKIRYAVDQEDTARKQRRIQKLLTASKSPNPNACVEEIHYLPDRTLNRESIARLSACQWITDARNVVILGRSSVGKTYIAQALLNAACRHDHSALFFRLDDLANQLAVMDRRDPRRLDYLRRLHNTELLVIDDFLTTPITTDTASELLNILAARDGARSTLITSQFAPDDWYKSLDDAVVAESLLNRLISTAEIIHLDGPNMRRHTTDAP